MDGHRPFSDTTNTLNRRKRQSHEKLVTHDAGAGDSTDQSEAKRQRAREMYASMPADKKAELNAKRRESYQRKKAEREAARNNTENRGVASVIVEANMCNVVTLQPTSELNGRTTNEFDDQNNSKNLGVASVINEADMSNDVALQPTFELNGRTTDEFDDSWLHRNDSFQVIPLEDTSPIYRASAEGERQRKMEQKMEQMVLCNAILYWKIRS
ncbi:hypothetical protein PVAP13_7NG024434 [Panicum virgatum]|uniref:Uncharacterized protein n=1 Tax=Panicum virgatum TaxID=38727 RepID=A0A8T0PQU8_PANVG|nr:hypothetical protein PVAP13_7NG024434 [Panicum virgatum]